MPYLFDVDELAVDRHPQSVPKGAIGYWHDVGWRLWLVFAVPKNFYLIRFLKYFAPRNRRKRGNS